MWTNGKRVVNTPVWPLPSLEIVEVLHWLVLVKPLLLREKFKELDEKDDDMRSEIGVTLPLLAYGVILVNGVLIDAFD